MLASSPATALNPLTRKGPRSASTAPVAVAINQTTINGLTAAYAVTRAQAGGSAVDVTVTAYRWDADTAYHLVTITPAGSVLGPFRDMIGSLAPLSAAEAAQVRPRVIDVVTVTRGDTARSLAARMAFPDYQLERFLVLNGLDAGAALQPGTKVKLVVSGQ